MIKLASCAGDLLQRLDDCKPDDLACECCALQSLQAECFELCAGSPSTGFMTVMFDDCETLGDVNACSLPFKKTDNEQAKISKEKFGKRPKDSDKMKVIYKIKSVPGLSDSIVKSHLEVDVAVAENKSTVAEHKKIESAKTKENVTKVDTSGTYTIHLPSEQITNNFYLPIESLASTKSHWKMLSLLALPLFFYLTF
ncbi:unnamed protein product [Kuraishia capsulata CBS 1993]|uniref:Uncharacterized protein n=1 Tax=Kuraishia capsulata CBS 1993 TaxID=1382522 RepID=W6MTS0_9ASCO|nr:uncharacterized protein KUCA_T00004616001 [Kuraishia capsulata CBS 1993]CDK28632.1 unnamed protein product [Kuraishia capsulata CBS 1993]